MELSALPRERCGSAQLASSSNGGKGASCSIVRGISLYTSNADSTGSGSEMQKQRFAA